MEIKSFRTPNRSCPVCQHPLTGATDASGNNAKPSAGDYSVCINCGSFLRFGKRLTLCALTDADVAALDDKQRMRLQGARRLLREFHKRK